VRDRRSADRPDAAAIASMAKDLRTALRDVDRVQREMLSVTGTAWSDDGLVKAVVGPRGHLLELEIDPRVYRVPNSKALSTTILKTVRAATDDAMEQSQQILAASVPADLRQPSSGRLDLWQMSRMHDAELREKALKEGDDDGLR
jgi:DNA-binding protein YbaB